MKNSTFSLLNRYANMSGDKKIRLGLTLSQAVRRVRQDGIIAAKKLHGKRSRKTS